MTHPATVLPPRRIELRGIGKRFPGVVALQDVDLDLRSGTLHALVGENGAGKSTLISILSGVMRPDEGAILIDRRQVHFVDARAARAAGIAVVHQEADLFPDLSIAENAAFEHGWPRRRGLIDWPALKHSTSSALRLVGQDLDPARLASGLTPAERQLAGIAAALTQRASLLVLDEPTSSLSGAETQIMFDLLRRYRGQGGSILYVSRRLEEVFQLADEITVLRDGRRVWHGPLANMSPDRLIAWMVGREPVRAAPRPPKLAGPVRLACRNLSAADGSFRDVTLEVRAGELLGLYGLVGAGRTEWAHALLGLNPLRAGEIELDGKSFRARGAGGAARRGLVYLPEDRLRLSLCRALSVRANLVLAALRRLSHGPFVPAAAERRQARSLVEQLVIRLRSLEQSVGTLSGGNQQKVVLGRWLACEPGTLILDEPTRGVDVGAKAEIHALLRRLADSGRALVLISSDLPEVLTHCDRIGVFRKGRLAAVYDAGTVSAEQVGAEAMPRESEGEPEENRSLQLAANQEGTREWETWIRETGLFAAVVLVALFLAWRTDTFWRPETLRDVGETAALLALCGLGAALVILAGGIDISFGSIMALGSAVAGYLMEEGCPPFLAVVSCLTLSSAAGGLNAGLSLLGGVHPIVVTLGTMSLYRGLTHLLISSRAIHDVPAAFRAPLLADPCGVPASVWLVAGIVTVAWVLLGWTVAGREVYALGSNPNAARRTGIHRARVWLGVFTLQGLLAGLAGLVALGLAGHLHASDFEEKSLEAIGVAVVGGIAITGGRGSIWGMCAAALLFRVLEKGWVLLAISSYWQRTIVGSLLLLAILGDRLWKSRGEGE